MEIRVCTLFILLLGYCLLQDSNHYTKARIHGLNEPQRHDSIDVLEDLRQQNKDPPIFKNQPVMEGTWKANSPAAQFNEFKNTQGWGRCQFAYRTPEPTSTKLFYLEIVDGVLFCRTRFIWIS